MGGWTEYDMVRAENRIFDKRVFTEAMIAEAMGPSLSKKRPMRRGLIWALTTLASLLAGTTPAIGADTSSPARSSNALAG